MPELIRPIYHPVAYKEESPLGYLFRLSDMNKYKFIHWLFKDNFGALSYTFKNLLHSLIDQPWTGFDECDELSNKISELPGKYLNYTSCRYCPSCLRADGYYRNIWHIKSVVACPRHNVWLVDTCHSCNSRLNFRELAGLHSCSCGADLRLASSIELAEDVRRYFYLLSIEKPASDFHSWPYSICFGMKNWSLEVRISYLHFFASWQPIDLNNFDHRGAFGGLNSMDSAKPYIESLAMSLCGNEQSCFHEFLDKLQHSVESSPDAGDALLRRFYKAFYKVCTHDDFDALRISLQEYLNDNWMYAVNHRNTLFSDQEIKAHNWVSLQTISRQFGIGQSKILHAISSEMVRAHYRSSDKRVQTLVHRQDLIRYFEQEKNYVDFKTTASLLGITRKQLKSLIDAEVLKGKEPEKHYQSWSFSLDDIHELIDTLKEVVPFIEDSRLSLADAIRKISNRIDNPLVRLYDAILNEDVKCFYDSKYVGLSGLLIDEASLMDWYMRETYKEDSSVFTKEQLKMLLKLSSTLIKQLVDKGFLEKSMATGPGNCTYISQEAVIKFQEQYVVLSKLSNATGIESRGLISLLSELNIQSIDADWPLNEALFQKVYLRRDLVGVKEVDGAIRTGDDWAYASVGAIPQAQTNTHYEWDAQLKCPF